MTAIFVSGLVPSPRSAEVLVRTLVDARIPRDAIAVLPPGRRSGLWTRAVPGGWRGMVMRLGLGLWLGGLAGGLMGAVLATGGAASPAGFAWALSGALLAAAAAMALDPGVRHALRERWISWRDRSSGHIQVCVRVQNGRQAQTVATWFRALDASRVGVTSGDSALAAAPLLGIAF